MSATKSVWRRIPLDDIKAPKRHALNGGPFGSKLVSRDYMPSGVPVIRGVNLPESVGFLDHSFVYVSDRKAEDLNANMAEPGDIVFTQRGTLGQVGIIPRSSKFRRYAISQSQMKLTVDKQNVSPEYVYYYFRSPKAIQQIHDRSISSGVPHINLDILRKFEIDIPPLSTQRKIAAVLSAYDDLIENNTRRIAILEEMARSLYREWFVRFRFPDHEHMPMVDSALGPIPDEWEVRKIGDAVETVDGGTPSTERPEYWEDPEVIWYSPTDLTSSGTMFISNSQKKISPVGLQHSSARLFPAYSVMLTSRATIGVIAINTKPACTNQGFITCIPNERVSAYQLYFWLLENRETITSLASGATFKEINKSTFRGLPIAIAPQQVSAQFVQILQPVGHQIENLQDQNGVLRRTRDLLLPRLVSGEVDVSELEITGVGTSG